MILRYQFIDAGKRYLFPFLFGFFMQHMAHSFCVYYTAFRPLLFAYMTLWSFYITKSEALTSNFVDSLGLPLCETAPSVFLC